MSVVSLWVSFVVMVAAAAMVRRSARVSAGKAAATPREPRPESIGLGSNRLGARIGELRTCRCVGQDDADIEAIQHRVGAARARLAFVELVAHTQGRDEVRHQHLQRLDAFGVEIIAA